jgi:(2Fe-2S) ferredoxin
MSSPVRLVVCVNERLGTGQKSCVGSGNLDYISSIRQLIEDHGLNVPIVERECLGKCEQGPIMRIAPGGKFFTDIDQNTLTAIVEELKAMLTQTDSGVV